MKKYKLTDETREWYGRTLYRIEALRDFANVEAGDKGGWVESEKNLSQEGNCWVYGSAQVCGNARVYGNAWVYGDARVYGDAYISSNGDWLAITGLGSQHRTTTIYRTESGVGVRCGCFYGTLDEFEDKVRRTHGDSRYAREYLALVEVARIHFGEEANNETV